MVTVRKLKLLHILVRDMDLMFTWHEYLSKREFTKDLKGSNPLLFITSIWILYRFGKGRILQLEIKDKKGLNGEWQVYNMNKPFFSFTCSNGAEYMKNFERNLNIELGKLPLIKTVPTKDK